jgi:hypothetical protein
MREMPELAPHMPEYLRVPERRQIIETATLQGMSANACDRALPNRVAFQMGEWEREP